MESLFRYLLQQTNPKINHFFSCTKLKVPLHKLHLFKKSFYVVWLSLFLKRYRRNSFWLEWSWTLIKWIISYNYLRWKNKLREVRQNWWNLSFKVFICASLLPLINVHNNTNCTPWKYIVLVHWIFDRYFITKIKKY